MAQPPGTQQQQVIYLVMDESQQGQQLQFIDGQPTLVMAQAGVPVAAGGTSTLATTPASVAGNSDSQVLLVSEDGQLVTGNEGQVVVDEQGQVVMTTDEGQQVALETEHLNVTNEQQGQIQYVLTSETTTTSPAKPGILSQAGSIITGGQVGAKATNGDAKDEDGYTTIVIGGNQSVAESTVTSEGYKTILIDNNSEAAAGINSIAVTKSVTAATRQSHPILSHQLNVSQSPMSKSPGRGGGESPRAKPAMVSILDKARLASLTQQQASLQQQNSEATAPKPQIIETESPSVKVSDSTAPVPQAIITQQTLPDSVEQGECEPMEVDTSVDTTQGQQQTPAPEVSTNEIGEKPLEAAPEVLQESSMGIMTSQEPQGVTEEAPEQMIHIENIPLSDSMVEAPEATESSEAIIMTSETPDIQDTTVSASDTNDILQESFDSGAGEVVLQPADSEQVLSGSSAGEAVQTVVEERPESSEPEVAKLDHELDTVTDDMYITETVAVGQHQLTDPDGITAVASEPPPASLKPSTTEMVRSLEDYMTRRPVPAEPTQPKEEVVDGNVAPQEVEAAPVLQEETDMHDVEEPAGLITDVGMGTMLGPLRYDSDDSAPEVESFEDEPALTIDTSESKPDKPKKTEKRQGRASRSSVEEKVRDGSESDTSSRRRSSRNKSPKRYSEEPIIFGDDFTKPEPKPVAAVQDSTPKKKGRPPKKRPYYVYEEIETSESEGITQSEEEEPVPKSDAEKLKCQPPKKRLSRGDTSLDKESSEESSKNDVVAEVSPKKRGRPPKKRFLEKHNSEEGIIVEEKSKEVEEPGEETSIVRSRRKVFEKKPTPVYKTWSFRRSTNEKKFEGSPKEPTVLSKVGEKKLTEDTKGEILDHFGFHEDSEKEEDVMAPQEIQIKPPETILVEKPVQGDKMRSSLEKEVFDKKSEPVDKALGQATPEKQKQQDVLKPTEETQEVQTTPSKAAPEAKPVKTPTSETKSRVKHTETKASSNKAARSMGTTSMGDRKLGIDFKSMKFSVSKRLSTTPETKKIFTSAKKTSPPLQAKTSHMEAVEKDMKYRDTALTKREQKARALDMELDQRASQLRVKEAKLDRLQRKLKETENNLEYRERRIKREEQALENEKDSPSKTPKEHRKRTKVESSIHEEKEKELNKKEKALKELEKKLATQERDLNKREEQIKQESLELDQKKELLATTEQQLTALSKELGEKYMYLQDHDQGATPETSSPAKGIVRQGLFEKIASLGKATELVMLKQPKKEGKRGRESEEEEEPPRKRTRTEGKEKANKAETKLSLIQRFGRPKKDKASKQQKSAVNDSDDDKNQPADTKKQKPGAKDTKTANRKLGVLQRLAGKGRIQTKTRVHAVGQPSEAASSEAATPVLSRQSSRSSSTGGKPAPPRSSKKAPVSTTSLRGAKSSSTSKLPRAAVSASSLHGMKKDSKPKAATPKAKSVKTDTAMSKQPSRSSLRASTRQSITPKGRKK